MYFCLSKTEKLIADLCLFTFFDRHNISQILGKSTRGWKKNANIITKDVFQKQNSFKSPTWLLISLSACGSSKLSLGTSVNSNGYSWRLSPGLSIVAIWLQTKQLQRSVTTSQPRFQFHLTIRHVSFSAFSALLLSPCLSWNDFSIAYFTWHFLFAVIYLFWCYSLLPLIR